jgi:long-subunit acyl-CoA synthetase (AMP-forming)
LQYISAWARSIGLYGGYVEKTRREKRYQSEEKRKNEIKKKEEEEAKEKVTNRPYLSIYRYAIQNNQSLPWGWWLANAVVFNKVKRALGLDRARLLGTGAAPISRETIDFFLSLNIPLYEIYGMSECTGPATATTPAHPRTGCAGIKMSGTDIKIDNPDAEGNGEV